MFIKKINVLFVFFFFLFSLCAHGFPFHLNFPHLINFLAQDEEGNIQKFEKYYKSGAINNNNINQLDHHKFSLLQFCGYNEQYQFLQLILSTDLNLDLEWKDFRKRTILNIIAMKREKKIFLLLEKRGANLFCGIKMNPVIEPLFIEALLKKIDNGDIIYPQICNSISSIIARPWWPQVEAKIIIVPQLKKEELEKCENEVIHLLNCFKNIKRNHPFLNKDVQFKILYFWNEYHHQMPITKILLNRKILGLKLGVPFIFNEQLKKCIWETTMNELQIEEAFSDKVWDNINFRMEFSRLIYHGESQNPCKENSKQCCLF